MSQADIDWEKLLKAAWSVRENSLLVGQTKVGSAALGSSGRIFAGCNVEQQYRSHDVHAEVNAISSMVAAGDHRLVAIVVVAERERFTPCGACLDWIFQLGGETCRVAYQNQLYGPLHEFMAVELMPYYPR